MNLAASSGPFGSAGATRRAPVPGAAAQSIARLGTVDLIVVGARGVVVVVLPVVGLLLGLVLITAGCGPPN